MLLHIFCYKELLEYQLNKCLTTYLCLPYENPISIRFLHFIVIEVYYYDTSKKHNIFSIQKFVDINISVIFLTVFIIDSYIFTWVRDQLHLKHYVYCFTS